MEATTATGTAGAGVQSASPAPADDVGLERTFDNLMDAITRQDDKNFDPTTGDYRQQGENQDGDGTQQRAEGENQEGEEGDDAAAKDAKDKGDDKGAKAKGEGDEQEGEEGDGKEYASLDEYLAENKLDPEAFKQLTITTKVDGVEKPVTIAELVKDHQLASASYARMNELAQERTSFQGEQTNVRQALGLQIARTEALLKAAHEQLMGDYAALTPQVLQDLRAKDPGQYAAIMQDFQTRQGAIAAILQQVNETRQQQARDADKQRQASMPQQVARLMQARPEWRDPAKANAARQAMHTLGRKIGFTDAELNGIFDYRYMVVLDMAARFAQLQAKESATLTRVRSAPRMAKPGTRKAPVNPKVASYKAAQERLARDPSNTDAQAAVFEHFV